MGNTLRISADPTNPSSAMNFDPPHIGERRRRPPPNLWFKIAVKLLAFAAGCLISLAFGLYDNDLPAAPKAHAWHGQAADQTTRSRPDGG